MEYDKEFEEWYKTALVGRETWKDDAHEEMHSAWQAARKDHYRIGEEVDKPGVWDKAPEWATKAMAVWYGKDGQVGHSKDYTRELPKSRIDEIAEEVGIEEGKKYGWSPAVIVSAIEIAKAAILKDREEREANR